MALDSPRAEFFRRITGHTIEVMHRNFGRQEMFAPDGLAVAVALEPSIVQRSVRYHVRVELTGQLTRGQTVVDWSNRAGQQPNVDIVLDMDRQRLWELLQAALA